ncbi:secreted protein [gut metagenome]|uniref:Secreted protein n=1 Tax=gut metagenome TaxID=749906 RepID=J9GBP6_9ZZZZ
MSSAFLSPSSRFTKRPVSFTICLINGASISTSATLIRVWAFATSRPGSIWEIPWIK